MLRSIENQLEKWKDATESRRPLLLSGARQTGKTWTLRHFGEAHFKNVMYVNLETDLDAARLFDENIDPRTILRGLEAVTGQRFTEGESLLILDEIQSCPRALTALKYFCELAPRCHVAAAGSLLGVAIHREQFSFPVGNVCMLRMHPLNFEEFLLAKGFDVLAGEIRSHTRSLEPLPEAIHIKALELYREYIVVGGMPSAISAFVQSGSFLDAREVHRNILNSYVADMAKYASAQESVRIRACYGSIPAQLAKDNKKFQYKVVKKGGTTAYFGPSIEWLEYAGVVLQCSKVEHAYDPITAYADLAAFKLYMSDTGLLSTMSGISLKAIYGEERSQFTGALTENFVAQQLAAQGCGLHYWESDGRAELDFVLQKDGPVLGVEVKSTINVHAKSLGVFRGKYPQAKTIRVSMRNFGTDGSLVSLPLYAAFCLLDAPIAQADTASAPLQGHLQS